jgi:uncharacterized RDD family membrane protein YckC
MDSKKEITIGIRLASMLLDHFIMTFAMFIPILPFMIIEMKDMFEVSHEQTSPEPTFVIYGFILAFVMYFNKDFFNGRSPAKRLLKIQVVNNKTDEVAGPLKCLLRNLTIAIWPIEVIFVLFNPQRRLGDYIAGTRIEQYDNDRVSKRTEFKDYLIPLAVGLLFTYLITLPFTKLTESWNKENSKYIKESYNENLSQKLTSFMSFRFSNCSDSVSIRFYDKIQNDSLKFISLLFFANNENLLESSSMFTDLEKQITDTLNVKLAPKTYVFNGKIIYRIPGSIRIKYMYYDPREAPKVDFRKNSNFINDSLKVIKEFYDNGQMESEATYVQGKLSGVYKQWYKNGKLKIEINYKVGQREGITTTWYENGQKESEMLYEKNTYVKDIRRWSKNGDTIRVDI